MSGYEVGQRVWCYNVNARGREPEAGTVVKVGRTLVTVERTDGWARSEQYRMDSGQGTGPYGHHAWIRTDAERSDEQRRTQAAATLNAARLKLDYGCTLSTDTLEAIASLVAASSGLPGETKKGASQ